MSTRFNNGSHYENHQRAAELHDDAAHAHRVASQQGKQDHLSGHEHSRQALEHSQHAQQQTRAAASGERPATFGHDDIAVRAHQIWLGKGCPEGLSQEDWYQAAEELRAAHSRPLAAH